MLKKTHWTAEKMHADMLQLQDVEEDSQDSGEKTHLQTCCRYKTLKKTHWTAEIHMQTNMPQLQQYVEENSLDSGKSPVDVSHL